MYTQCITSDIPDVWLKYSLCILDDSLQHNVYNICILDVFPVYSIASMYVYIRCIL